MMLTTAGGKIGVAATPRGGMSVVQRLSRIGLAQGLRKRFMRTHLWWRCVWVVWRLNGRLQSPVGYQVVGMNAMDLLMQGRLFIELKAAASIYVCVASNVFVV